MINLGFAGMCESCRTIGDLRKLEKGYSKITNYSYPCDNTEFAICPMQTSNQMKEGTQDNSPSDSGFIFNPVKNTLTKKPDENFAEHLVEEIK